MPANELRFPQQIVELRRYEGVHPNYRFRIQPLAGAREQTFQLTVGMSEERDFELIPAHRTAFAHHLALKPSHPTPADVQIELTALLEWIANRGTAAS